MPATLATPSPLEAVCLVVGIVKCQRNHCAGCLIGQIKLTRIHVASLYLPGVRVKRYKKPSLYNVERSANLSFYRNDQQTLSLCSTRMYLWERQVIGSLPRAASQRQQETRKAKPFFEEKWWSLTGSNRRHPACKAGALPAELRPHSF